MKANGLKEKNTAGGSIPSKMAPLIMENGRIMRLMGKVL